MFCAAVVQVAGGGWGQSSDVELIYCVFLLVQAFALLVSFGPSLLCTPVFSRWFPFHNRCRAIVEYGRGH